ncbi:MAG: Ig-like domain-containing protein, partial [Gemmatimonadaceae bacterium]
MTKRNVLQIACVLGALGTLVSTAAAQVAAAPNAAPRLVITPSTRSVVAGDSLQLRAQLVDAAGTPVPNARVRFQAAGGHFEGSVDSSGLVRAGAVGTLPMAVIGLISGEKPVVQRFEVAMVPGAAARVAVTPKPARLAIGQRVHLGATVFSKASDRRDDRVQWTSSAPAIVRVSSDGILVAQATGRATISATAGSASEKWAVDVAASPIASVEI